MRYHAVLFATFVLAACSTAPVTLSEPAAVSAVQVSAPELEASSAEAVQFLLEAAAADFHTRRPPHVIGFRDVRVGHVMTPDGAKQYMLCGEFLPAQNSGEVEWEAFATIKTSGYEQWLGAPAAGLCQRRSIVWGKEGDLSSSLQNRLDSLR